MENLILDQFPEDDFLSYDFKLNNIRGIGLEADPYIKGKDGEVNHVFIQLSFMHQGLGYVLTFSGDAEKIRSLEEVNEALDSFEFLE